MKLHETYRFSNAFGALVLLLQLQCFAFSKHQTRNYNANQLASMNADEKIMIAEPEVDRALEENILFDFSEIEHSINATIITDDEISGNQSEEPPNDTTSLPFSGSTFFIPVETTINLQLVNTPTLMDQDQLNAFREITVGILSFYLLRGTFLPSMIETEGIEVDIIGQTRSTMVQLATGQALQPRNDGIPEPLYVSLRIAARIYEEDIEDANLRFDKALGDIFAEKEGEYVEALILKDGDYFRLLNEANIVAEITADIIPYDEAIDVAENGTKGEGEGSNQNKEEDQKADDVPFQDPEPNSSNKETKDAEDGEIQGGTLPLGPIIGIAISGCILLVLVVVLVLRKRGRNMSSNDAGPKIPSPRKKKMWSNYGELQDPVDSIVSENLLSSDRISSDQKSYVCSNDDLESQAMYSYNPSGTASISTNGRNVKILPSQSYNFDNMSYAFSLEPGIEASIVEGVNPSDRSDFFRNKPNGSDLPVQEIPHVRMSTDEKPMDVDRMKTNAQKTEGEYVMYDHFGNTQIEREPSDLKLTESELQMLPSNLRGSSVESELKFVTRDVMVPAGKLGIVIDTSLEGPVVHSVKKDSYLYGRMFPGDIIVAIDNVDTRTMSASAVTALMGKTSTQRRNLTVQRAA